MGEQDSGEKIPAGGMKKGKKDKAKAGKVVAEGLPSGWIKEVRVTKKSRKVRRDAFYVDPTSGYVFRSMKDALRYVETGVVGKLAIPPKDTDKTDEEDSVPASPAPGGSGTSSNEESPGEKNGPKRVKSAKKTPDLPRRASKRLAGIAMDQTPETEKCESPGKEAKKGKSSLSPAAKNEHSGKVETESKAESPGKEAKKGKSSLSPAVKNEHSGKVETESKAESSEAVLPQKSDDLVNQISGSGPSLNLPLADIWSDPCIAFAIKTLTGIPDDTPKVSSESNSSKYPMTTSEEHTGNILPSEPVGKLETSNDMPCADMFSDPCIEFAIKTLTGVIPIESDLDNQGYLQPQSSSHSTFSDVGSGNYPRTMFNVTEHQTMLESGFSFTRTASLQSSGGTVLHHRGNGRR